MRTVKTKGKVASEPDMPEKEVSPAFHELLQYIENLGPERLSALDKAIQERKESIKYVKTTGTVIDLIGVLTSLKDLGFGGFTAMTLATDVEGCYEIVKKIEIQHRSNTITIRGA